MLISNSFSSIFNIVSSRYRDVWETHVRAGMKIRSKMKISQLLFSVFHSRNTFGRSFPTTFFRERSRARLRGRSRGKLEARKNIASDQRKVKRQFDGIVLSLFETVHKHAWEWLHIPNVERFIGRHDYRCHASIPALSGVFSLKLREFVSPFCHLYSPQTIYRDDKFVLENDRCNKEIWYSCLL